ncbi:hypothetical protein VP01_1620g3 [Puccinia sorghi]|uniref:Uncharacterized protein n=1 Tax=Puccinia sorghi TaxID=27349 RepID=A0A0L6VH09_9BASI|nr:hypothetical protein VP01_1620g3 [Puccinia sorghi]
MYTSMISFVNSMRPEECNLRGQSQCLKIFRLLQALIQKCNDNCGAGNNWPHNHTYSNSTSTCMNSNQNFCRWANNLYWPLNLSPEIPVLFLSLSVSPLSPISQPQLHFPLPLPPSTPCCILLSSYQSCHHSNETPISCQSFNQWLASYKETKFFIQNPNFYEHVGHSRTFSTDNSTLMFQLLKDRPGLFLEEICKHLHGHTGTLLSMETLEPCSAWKHWNLAQHGGCPQILGQQLDHHFEKGLCSQILPMSHP